MKILIRIIFGLMILLGIYMVNVIFNSDEIQISMIRKLLLYLVIESPLIVILYLIIKKKIKI